MADLPGSITRFAFISAFTSEKVVGVSTPFSRKNTVTTLGSFGRIISPFSPFIRIVSSVTLVIV